MNKSELKKVLKIIMTADSGCSSCVHNLIDQVHKEFKIDKQEMHPLCLEIIQENEKLPEWGVVDDEEVETQEEMVSESDLKYIFKDE